MCEATTNIQKPNTRSPTKCGEETKSQISNVLEKPETTKPKSTEKPKEKDDDYHGDNITTALPHIKERYKLLKKFADQSLLLVHSDQEPPAECQKIKELLEKYTTGLVQLFLQQCLFYQQNSKPEEVLRCLGELTKLTNIVQNSDLHVNEQIQDFCKNYRQTTAKENHNISERANNFLKEINNYKHKKSEYDIIAGLSVFHAKSFNTQECIDHLKEASKLAERLQDKTLQYTCTQRKGFLCSILGKYRQSYEYYKSLFSERIEDFRTNTNLYVNTSVVLLLLGKTGDSLKYALKSLQLAKKDLEAMSLSHGNIGLACLKLGYYPCALKRFNACLQLGIDRKDDRVINNSYCNLGRTYKKQGNTELAKKYFEKAVTTPQPPNTHWCDTENMRFSGDYQLAKIYIANQTWDKAEEYLESAVNRCEVQRQSVHDSSLKIVFNDTQRKPFQYLQHVLLQKNNKEKALLVSEKGRARDFHDTVIREQNSKDSLNTSEALIEFVKTQNVAVLMLSTLQVVNKLCGWFISPDGAIQEFSVSINEEWQEILNTKLCVSMHLLEDSGSSAPETSQKTEDRGVIAAADNSIFPEYSKEIVVPEIELEESCNCDDEDSNILVEDYCMASDGTSNGSPPVSPKTEPTVDDHRLQVVDADKPHICQIALMFGGKGRCTSGVNPQDMYKTGSTGDVVSSSQIQPHQLTPDASAISNSLRKRRIPTPNNTDSTLQDTIPEMQSQQRDEIPTPTKVRRLKSNTFANTQPSKMLTTATGMASSDETVPQIQNNNSRSADTSQKHPSATKTECTEKSQVGETSTKNQKEFSSLITELSELFLKPIEKPLDKLIAESHEKPTLIIIPQMQTFNIPYAALQLHGEPLCNKVTTLEEYSLHSYAHAVRQLTQQPKENSSNLASEILIVGNPTCDLKRAEEEACLIGRLLGVEPLIKEAATRDKVLAQLPNVRIAHFACHGTTDGKSLILAKVGDMQTFLSVADITMTLDRLDLVVLGACHTHRGKLSSEGVQGLARAFCMAGAKCVVTALWAIPDASTMHFMEHFYENLRRSQPVGDALSGTMSEMQKNKQFGHIVKWGAFKALGANCKVF